MASLPDAEDANESFKLRWELLSRESFGGGINGISCKLDVQARLHVGVS